MMLPPPRRRGGCPRRSLYPEEMEVLGPPLLPLRSLTSLRGSAEEEDTALEESLPVPVPPEHDDPVALACPPELLE